MKFRHLMLGWAIGGVLSLTGGPAWGQFHAVTPVGPVGPVGPVQTVPIGPIGSGLTTIPQTPNLTPATGISGLAPLGPSPSVSPPGGIDTRATAPEPPEVHENPPVLPYHRDDDKLPRDGNSSSKDDPMWMYRALDKIAADTQNRMSQFQPPQAPAGAPSGPAAAPPPPPPAKAETGSRGWWILAAIIIVLAAYSAGRGSRAR